MRTLERSPCLSQISKNDMKKNPLTGIAKCGRPPKTNADRQAEFVSKRSELGEIPPPADLSRREACRFDLLQFGLTYCLGKGAGFLIKRKPSERMLPYILALQDSYSNDRMVHVRWPRGKGKTSWMKIAELWAASYGHKKYLVLFAATQPNADAIMDDIWDLIEECEPYGSDFPEIAIPVRALEGRMQRCTVQSVLGKRTKIKRGKDRICFPRIDGYASSGVMFVSRGRESGVRGLVKGSQRPDHVAVDDPQTRQTAKSTDVSKDVTLWLQGDVLGLAGHDCSMCGVLTTTPIYAGDVSDQYADPDLHPEWMTISSPLVIKWPDRMDLWDEYLEERRRDEIKGVKNFTNATAFYRANRIIMDTGAVVLDDGDGDPKTEASALQHAFNLLFKVKSEAFEAEYQLTPRRSGAAFQLSAKAVAANISQTKRLELPSGFHSAVAFIDCMSKDALRWTILGIGPARKGVVLAYGRYPETGVLFPPNALVPEQNKALATTLTNLIDMIATTPIKSERGNVFVCGIAPDRNWKPRIIEWVCSRSKHKNILWPSRGIGWSKYSPERTDGKAKLSVLGVGDHCFTAQGKGFRYLGHHTDYWKEYAQRSFLAPPLTAGATAIYGFDPLEHYDYGTEIASEVLADKGIGDQGTEFWRYTVRPGVRNHYLDCLVGCLALASWLRLYDATQTTAGKGNGKKAGKKVRKSRVRLVRGAA